MDKQISFRQFERYSEKNLILILRLELIYLYIFIVAILMFYTPNAMFLLTAQWCYLLY